MKETQERVSSLVELEGEAENSAVYLLKHT